MAGVVMPGIAVVAVAGGRAISAGRRGRRDGRSDGCGSGGGRRLYRLDDRVDGKVSGRGHRGAATSFRVA